MAKYDREEDTCQVILKKITLALIYILAALILVLIIAMLFNAWSAKDAAVSQETTSTSHNTDEKTNTPLPESEVALETEIPNITNTPDDMPKIPYGQPLDYGFDPEKLNSLSEFIQEQIDDGFPGAVLMIAKDGHIIFDEAYGYSKKYDGMSLLSQFENMQKDTMFDLASLSKIYSTTFSIMKLVDEGKISLEGKVSDYLPGYTGTNKDKVTVQMLLSHNAGYVENYYFYKNEYKTFDRNMVYNYVRQIPSDDNPGEGYDYNDINFVILGMIVEQVSGMRLDVFAKANIYEPLNIELDVTYRPLDAGIEKSQIAATERMGNTRDGSVYFDGIRQYTLQGEVHDENAYYCMEQVAGHAGLFATSYGLTVLNQLLLNGGEYEGVRIYSQETIDNWLRIINNQKYQLGLWNAKAASDKLKSYVSDSTFYHNGWTGTATIIDKENNLSIILLTNKRHSPCPDGDFEGTDYSIAYYVTVVQKVYKAMID